MKTLARLLIFLLTVCGSAAGAGYKKEHVVLYLNGGLYGHGKHIEIELEFPVRDGRWADTGWGYSTGFSRGQHTPRILKNEVSGGVRNLAVEVRIGPDRWIPGGWARYDIELKQDGEKFTGTFTGSHVPGCVAWGGGPKNSLPPALRENPAVEAEAKPDFSKGHKLEGKVSGHPGGSWPAPVPGYAKPEPGEHPRLAFRKKDLPLMRKRATETPEGKAIVERARRTLGGGPEDSDKFTTWPACGHAFLYLITGEQRHADKAREIVERTLLDNPAGRKGRGSSQDIHHGPRLQGFALAFDMCYDGWPEDFRLRCIDEIQRRTWELHWGDFEGKGMSGYNPNPWSNHDGIRSACTGLGALAVLGEKNSLGRTMECAEEIAEWCAVDIRRHYLTGGVGTAGYCIEGSFYKWMTAQRGLVYFVPAYENVMGKRFDSDSLRDFEFIGDLMERRGVAPIGWSVGIHAVPESMMPGYKWLFDRQVGLQSKGKTMGVKHGMMAPFILTLYPYDVEAVPPGQSFPWMAPDPRKGHWIFRPNYDDPENDILLTTNVKSENFKGSWAPARAGTHWDIVLHAYGKYWLNNTFVPKANRFPAGNEHHGGRVTSWKAADDKTCVINWDMRRAFYKEGRRGSQTLADHAKSQNATIVEIDGWGPFIDYRIRATRSMAVDCSGKSGAPILVAIVDRVTLPEKPKKEEKPVDTGQALFLKTIGGGEKPPFAPKRATEVAPVTWKLPILTTDLRSGGKVVKKGLGEGITIEGNRFSAAETGGLTGILAEPRTISKSLKVDGEGELFMVLTVQKGKAPEMVLEGTGLGTKVKVGNRTVRFDGEQIVLE